MNKLQKLCPAKTESELRELATQFGFNPDKLTDEQAEAIASEVNKSAITPVKSTKSNGNGRSTVTPNDVDVEALKKAGSHALNQKQKDLNGFEQGFNNRRNKIINDWVSRMQYSVQTMPSDAVNLLTQQLMQEGSNPESFSRQAEQLFSEFVSTNESAETA